MRDEVPDFESPVASLQDVENAVKGRELTDEEEKEYRDGLALAEMKGTNPGWQIVKNKLESFAFHSWIDPRGLKKEEWEWAELSAYHASNNAKELLEWIDLVISRSEALGRKRSGEDKVKKFRI